MSALGLLLLILSLQATDVYCQDGGHVHSHYVSEQEMDELRSEINHTMAVAKSEWERKEASLKDEQSFWKQTLVSLIKIWHSATSVWNYWEQQKEELQEVEDTIDSLQNYINDGTSASSCKVLRPDSASGLYLIKDGAGNMSQQYCDMEREACGVRGGWMRIAHLDMTQPGEECPTGFRTIISPKSLCGRPGPRDCVSVTFPTLSIPYNKVCGKVIAYQNKTPDGHCPYKEGSSTIDKGYIDGVSITYGNNPRIHVWTFIAAHGENRAINSCSGCPCFTNYRSTSPDIPFVGEHYFCDSGTEGTGLHEFYADDPLWDGEGCGPTSQCCTFNNPPWFCRELNSTTSDDIELRLCGNEPITNEDVPIEKIELYVQ